MNATPTDTAARRLQPREAQKILGECRDLAIARLGTAFNANVGIPGGRAAIRRLDIAGGTTTLNATDDTNNSATNFIVGAPAPRNNANILGVAPASTCGNGSITGLEQCDDGNTANGDRCNSTCTAVTFEPRFDFNNDRFSDVPWRNSSSGANAIWRSANNGTPQAVTSLTNLQWRVVGIGDFDNTNTADLLWRNTSTGANVIWRAANSTTQTAVATAGTQWSVGGIGDFNDGPERDLAFGQFGDDDRRHVADQSVVARGWHRRFRRRRTRGRAVAQRVHGPERHLAPRGQHDHDPCRDLVDGVGDFNGDRGADILWRNASTGANATWRYGTNNSAFALTTRTGTWRISAVADYNNDMRDDIFWRNTSTGANGIWRSGNSATPQTVATLASQAWQVVP